MSDRSEDVKINQDNASETEVLVRWGELSWLPETEFRYHSDMNKIVEECACLTVSLHIDG